MPSTNECEYCGSTITSNDSKCPNCGASNPLFVVDTERIITDPKTIEELQEYCAERGMPLRRMRFFIGIDYKEPKAFGIYKDEKGIVTVYKNKGDGTRSIRYQGPDEAHGVNELYLKLIQECHNRGIYPDGSRSLITNENESRTTRHRPRRRLFSFRFTKKLWEKIKTFLIFSFVGLMFIIMLVGLIRHPDGYYQYNDTLYYYKGSTWYYYDSDYDDWYYADVSETGIVYDAATDYYLGYDSTWADDWGAYDFQESSAYAEYVESHKSDSGDSSNGSSYGSSYDRSYDSWDSDSTDWDSNW